jgi:uncharacterized membrane protein
MPDSVSSRKVMMLPMLIVIYAAVGLLLCGVSIPLIQKKIKRNWFYGIRTPKTMKSDEVWYPANAYGGKWLFGAGLAVTVAALGLALVPNLTIDSYAIIMVVVMLAVMIVSMIQIFRYIGTLPNA